MSSDNQATPILNLDTLTPLQLAFEQIITKVFHHYSITLDVSDKIRATFKTKLWRMGRKLSTTGGKQRNKLLCCWKDGDESVWNFTADEGDVNSQLMKRKRQVEELQQEMVKRQKLEDEVKDLKQKFHTQSQIISHLSLKKKRRSRSKHWTQYSRQQKIKMKRQVAENVKVALDILCKSEKMKACSVEMINIDTKAKEVLNLDSGSFTSQQVTSPTTKVNSTILIKDKFVISNAAYHELSMIHTQLPKSSEIQKHIKDMNSQLTITSRPNNTMGVQLSLKTCITTCLLHFVPTTTGTHRKVRIKLTGDGTQIARGLNVVVFAFPVLERDLNPTSVHGSHPVAIIKTKETFESLSTSLQNIIDEASALDKISINGVTFEIELFLGGDWKFLAMICGLDSATSRYSCIWCTCPKEEQWDMSKKY